MKLSLHQQPGETELQIHCADPEAAEIQELRRWLSGSVLPAQEQGVLRLFAPHEVLYGEFVGRGVFLYTAEGVYPTTWSLAQLQDAPHFVRCSKSMAVNLLAIRALRSERYGRLLATLSNGERILISRHYAATLRQRLLSHL